MSKNKSRKPNWLLRRGRLCPRTMLKQIDGSKLRQFYYRNDLIPTPSPTEEDGIKINRRWRRMNEELTKEWEVCSNRQMPTEEELVKRWGKDSVKTSIRGLKYVIGGNTK